MKVELSSNSVLKRTASLLMVGMLVSQISTSFAAVISAERVVNWQGNVGVPGGIPNRTTIFVNVATTTNSRYKCYGDGGTDNLSAIQNAINDCPADQVVYVPAGTYKVSGQVRIYSKSNWTLRGDGPGKTIFTGGGGSLFAFGQSPWMAEWAATTPITSGAVAGSSSITVSSTANIQNGQMMFLEQDNDANVFGFGCGGSGSATYNVDDRMHNNSAVFNHRVMVTSISGNTVNFMPPLPFNFNPSLNPRAVGFGSKYGPSYVGLEDLTVNGSSAGYGVWYQGMFGSWLKNVELTGWGTFGFKFDYVANISIVDCYIHDPATFNWSQGYPLQFDMANNCLVQNNIFYKYQAGLMVQGGCGANVIAYNLFFREYNAYLGTSDMLASMYGNHTPFPQYNLWEGNYGNGAQLDFYYGPSKTTTFLRNYLTGADPDISNARVVMKLDSHQWSNNVVGNILGSSGVSASLFAKLPNLTFNWAQTSPVTGWVYDSGTANFSFGQPTIFRLGYPYSGNNSSGGSANPPSTSQLNYIDLSVKANTLIHGNWDAAGQSVRWDANVSDHTIPSSLYLSSKPSWFGALNWPPYDSSKGSSMTLMNLTNIPAGYRFVYGVNPPTGTGNEAPVAVANASVLIALPAVPITFSSTGSYDPEGTALSYSWNFGDGTTSTAANPSHTFVGVGAYTVRLTVSDGVNSTTATALAISINLLGNQTPTAAASGNPTSGQAPLAVSFSSAGSSDPEGTALTYSWNFGDGTTSASANPTKTYSAGGNFVARLTVSDGVNTNISSPINISVTAPNNPPVAAASATPQSGTAPLAVTFSSAGSSDPNGTALTYSWTFGDGGTSTAANPSHTYSANGSYTAQLTVSDGTNSTAATALPIFVGDAAAGMVAAYSFDEGSGAITADKSGKNNTGALSNATWSASGKYGGALTFNGIDSLVFVPASSSLNVTNAMTQEAWVYPTTSKSSWETVMHRQTDAYYLHASSPDGAMRPAGGATFGGTESYVAGTNTVPLNTWTHLAATYDGTTLKIYINGNLSSSKTATGAVQSNNNPLRIGGNYPYGQFFEGMIDEVRVYNRALSQSEIQTTMNTALPGSTNQPPTAPAPPQNLRVVTAP